MLFSKYRIRIKKMLNQSNTENKVKRFAWERQTPRVSLHERCTPRNAVAALQRLAYRQRLLGIIQADYSCPSPRQFQQRRPSSATYFQDGALLHSTERILRCRHDVSINV